MFKAGCAFVLAAVCCPALVNAQRPTTGSVVISNGADCTTIAPTTDAIGDVTGASSSTGSCIATHGEYFFQTFPSGQIPPVVTYLPQVVDGGVWKTTIVIANTTASAGTASLTCYQETGAVVNGSTTGATQPWNPPFLESVTPQSMSLPPGSTIFLDTPGTNAALSQGWCAVTASDGVRSHAVFSLGLNNSQGTAAATIGSSDILVPVDNSNGSVTAIAVANPSSTSQTVTVAFQNSNGTISQPATLTMQPNGHNTFLMSSLFPESAGQRGLAEIIAGGSVSAIALQFNATLNFTSAEAYPVSNGPVIGAIDPIKCVQNPQTTGCPNPFFFLLTLNANFSLSSSAFPVAINITPGPVGYTASIDGSGSGQIISGSFVGGTLTGSGNQLTFAFQTPGSLSTFLGGSLNVTITETDYDAKIGEAVGTFSGQLVLTQPNIGGGTVNGIFTEMTPFAPTPWLVDVR